MADAIRAGVIGFGVAGRIYHAAVVDAVPGLVLACIVERHGDERATASPKKPRKKVAKALSKS